MPTTSERPLLAKVEPVWGEYRQHSHLSAQNIVNGLLCCFVLVPSFAVTAHLYRHCSPDSGDSDPFASACALAMGHPLWLANVLFFGNVTVAFWLIGLWQRSFWLIDPYWTLLPPLLGHLYAAHPRAAFNPMRSAMCLTLLWVWSLRLTHSYFRREDWKFGQREDWRYSKMARDFPRSWPLLSFFAVGLAQQPMLVGISLPAYTVHFAGDEELGGLDVLALLGALAGLVTGFTADNQLRAYMLANEARVAAGQPKLKLLDSGLWHYSRHPNYFGEQLWWWSFALFSVRLGQWYMVGGAFFNSIVLATVTFMTEEKMLTGWGPERVAMYREYIRRTSPCIPWFKKAAAV